MIKKASKLGRCARLCILLTTSSTLMICNVSKANEHDPALIQALQQATQNITEQTTDLNSLVWLATMSKQITKRIPNPFYRVRLLEAVYQEAQIAGLDPQLVLAVIDIESNFNRFAVSHAGAQGLMQVMPFWKDVHGKPNDDLFNPLVNLRYGCTILRHYMDMFDTQKEALAAYNGSRGRDLYPNKVHRRLARDWEFNDSQFGYSSVYEAELPEIAVEEIPEQSVN